MGDGYRDRDGDGIRGFGGRVDFGSLRRIEDSMKDGQIGKRFLGAFWGGREMDKIGNVLFCFCLACFLFYLFFTWYTASCQRNREMGRLDNLSAFRHHLEEKIEVFHMFLSLASDKAGTECPL